MSLPIELPHDCAHAHDCDECTAEYVCPHPERVCRDLDHLCPACVEQAAIAKAIGPDGYR
jgi:hypothetical protein